MKEVVYLTGPMSGIPHHNAPAFDAAATTLEDRGYTVINPSAEDRLDPEAPEGGLDWLTALVRDIPWVAKADKVAVMEGWEKSDGAKLEVYVALRLGKKVIDALTTKPINLCAFAPPIVQVYDQYSVHNPEYGHGCKVFDWISGN